MPAEGSSTLGKTIHHYRIIEKLGSGRMGVIYEAESRCTAAFDPVHARIAIPLRLIRCSSKQKIADY
jgi:hypothetical protein